MKAVIDSDVLIDFLQGDPRAKAELDQYRDLRYSIISWMEVMCGAGNEAEKDAASLLFSSMRRIELNLSIALRAVHLRKSLKLKLPDAIILASAEEEGCILVTRNTKDFRSSLPAVRVPYTG